jgi:hypothetical protein
MPVAKAKRGNQTIDGFADRTSPLTQTPELSRGLNSQVLTAGLKYLKLTKFTQHSHERLFVSDTLKGLAENQISPKRCRPSSRSK